MTSKTRTLVELSDLVGLSFECKGCGTTLSFDVTKDFKVKSIVGCCNCEELWVRNLDGGTIETTIAKFVSGLKDFKTVLEQWQEKRRERGFHLFLELNPATVRAIEEGGGNKLVKDPTAGENTKT